MEVGRSVVDVGRRGIAATRACHGGTTIGGHACMKNVVKSRGVSYTGHHHQSSK